MKAVPYTLIAVFAIGVTSGVSPAQQDTGSTPQTGKIAAPRQLNVTPVPLAPVSVVGTTPTQGAIRHTPLPINRTPVMLDPVHIVASRIDPHTGSVTLNTIQVRGRDGSGIVLMAGGFRLTVGGLHGAVTPE